MRWAKIRDDNKGNQLWKGRYYEFSMSIHKYANKKGLFYEVNTDNEIIAKGVLFSDRLQSCQDLAVAIASELLEADL